MAVEPSRIKSAMTNGKRISVNGATSEIQYYKTMNGRNRLSWEQTAIKLAFNIAHFRSEDPYVQVGAVIIKHDNSIILGYNGAPPGVEIDWSNRDARRERVLHAEENVLDAIKFGEAKIFAVTAMPCKRCMRNVAQKGIKKVYYIQELEGYDNDFAKQLAKEFGIELVKVDLDKMPRLS